MRTTMYTAEEGFTKNAEWASAIADSVVAVTEIFMFVLLATTTKIGPATEDSYFSYEDWGAGDVTDALNDIIASLNFTDLVDDDEGPAAKIHTNYTSMSASDVVEKMFPVFGSPKNLHVKGTQKDGKRQAKLVGYIAKHGMPAQVIDEAGQIVLDAKRNPVKQFLYRNPLYDTTESIPIAAGNPEQGGTMYFFPDKDLRNALAELGRKYGLSIYMFMDAHPCKKVKGLKMKRLAWKMVSGVPGSKPVNPDEVMHPSDPFARLIACVKLFVTDKDATVSLATTIAVVIAHLGHHHGIQINHGDAPSVACLAMEGPRGAARMPSPDALPEKTELNNPEFLSTCIGDILRAIAALSEQATGGQKTMSLNQIPFDDLIKILVLCAKAHLSREVFTQFFNNLNFRVSVFNGAAHAGRLGDENAGLRVEIDCLNAKVVNLNDQIETLGDSENTVKQNIGHFESELGHLRRQLEIQEDGFAKQMKQAEMMYKEHLLTAQREAAKAMTAKLTALRAEQATVEREIAERRKQPGRAAKTKKATRPN